MSLAFQRCINHDFWSGEICATAHSVTYYKNWCHIWHHTSKAVKEGWGREWDKDNIQEAARQRATTALVAAAPGVEDTRRADRKAAARADEEAAGMVIFLDAPM